MAIPRSHLSSHKFCLLQVPRPQGNMQSCTATALARAESSSDGHRVVQRHRVLIQPASVLPLAVWMLLWGSVLPAGATELDPRTEELMKMVKDKSNDEGPMDPTGEHPLKKLGPRSLVCSACKMAAARFQSKVARKLKGKWKEAKKRMHFDEHLPKVCQESAYPDQLAVIERNKDGQILVDFNDAMNQGGGGALSIKKMGADLKGNVIAACKHIMEDEFKDALLARFLSRSRPDGKDIDFTGWLCGKAQLGVCDIDEELGDEGDDDL